MYHMVIRIPLLMFIARYNKAYKSMKACPMKFSHPSEAQQLHGIGPKLCDRLTEKLREHCAEEGIEMPQPAHRRGLLWLLSVSPRWH